MAERTAGELGRALGSVVFDLQLLCVALLIEKQGYPPEQRRIMRHPARLATEIVLLKARSLLDFIAPSDSKKDDDITVEDFGVQPRVLCDVMSTFRTYVNKRAAHLTWRRIDQVTPGSLPDVCACAYRTALSTHQCVNSIMAAGITLQEPRHVQRHNELLIQLEELRPHFPGPLALLSLKS